MAEPHDTLVSVRAPVGDINVAFERCAAGRGIAAVRHKTGARSFTYYAMRSLSDEFSIYEGEGTLFGAIGGDAFRSLQIAHPPEGILATFEETVGPVDDLIELNEHETGTLSLLRDTLLPALLSGEITIRAAEKAVAEAV